MGRRPAAGILSSGKQRGRPRKPLKRTAHCQALGDLFRALYGPQAAPKGWPEHLVRRVELADDDAA